jgi:hypothetical protein
MDACGLLGSSVSGVFFTGSIAGVVFVLVASPQGFYQINVVIVPTR